MTDHRITPPPDELVDQWRNDNLVPENLANYVATQAARWGADQELEACCNWLSITGRWDLPAELLIARRPKPPSPKEEALKVLEALIEWQRIDDPEYQVLRHALEQLDD